MENKKSGKKSAIDWKFIVTTVIEIIKIWLNHR
jgi:hypothetical protein